MVETLSEKLTKTADGMRLYQQERAILEVTELVCQLMEEQQITRSDLANRLSKTKGYVTQLLDGRTNMTIRTISDVFSALGRTIHFQDGSLDITASPAHTLIFIDDSPKWGSWPPEWPQKPTMRNRIPEDRVAS